MSGLSPVRALSVAIAVLLVVAACSATGSSSSGAPIRTATPPSASAGHTAADVEPTSPAPATATPAPTEKPSKAPTAEPNTEPTPAPAELDRFVIADVITTDLRMRTQPTVGDSSKRFTPALQPGDQVLIEDGPVEADGYRWYQVTSLLDGKTPGHTGWVAAASRDGEPWIADRDNAHCPRLGSGHKSLPFTAREILLGCSGGKTIEFSLIGHFYCEPGFPLTPAMFGNACGIAKPPGSDTRTAVLVTMDPAAGLGMSGGGPGTWALIGHLADPAADDCATSGFLSDRMTPAEARHYCRMVLVLDTPPTALKQGY